MRSYREHLRVPASYWVLGFITMVTFASFVWAGFNFMIAIASYVVVVLLPGVALFAWGNATVAVSGGRLRAGRAALPLDRAGQVQALDPEATAKLRGPLADPEAFMLIRPYLKRAVYVEVAVPEGGADAAGPPYWLVGTRHPEALVAAIETSRPQSRAADPTVA
jgi:Protein of unknown function (DUF3093)